MILTDVNGLVNLWAFRKCIVLLVHNEKHISEMDE